MGKLATMFNYKTSICSKLNESLPLNQFPQLTAEESGVDVFVGQLCLDGVLRLVGIPGRRDDYGSLQVTVTACSVHVLGQNHAGGRGGEINC